MADSLTRFAAKWTWTATAVLIATSLCTSAYAQSAARKVKIQEFRSGKPVQVQAPGQIIAGRPATLGAKPGPEVKVLPPRAKSVTSSVGSAKSVVPRVNGRTSSGIKISEYGKTAASTGTNSGAKVVESDLRSTVESLRRSLAELKKSLREPRELRPSATKPLPVGPQLSGYRVDELAPYPGRSAQRLIRGGNGRLGRGAFPAIQPPPIRNFGPIAQASRNEATPTYVDDLSPSPPANEPSPFADNASSRRLTTRVAIAQEQIQPIQPAQPTRPSTQPQAAPETNNQPQEAEPLAEIKDPKSISSIAAAIAHDDGELPPDYAAMRFAKAGESHHYEGASRNWGDSAFRWEAAAMRHGPLYFEDVNLERHGHTAGVLQPAVSAAHFFGRVPALPYLMGARPPRDCIYTLGHYRPGTCAPYERHWPPVSVRGGLLEAGVATGLIFLIP